MASSNLKYQNKNQVNSNKARAFESIFSLGERGLEGGGGQFDSPSFHILRGTNLISI